MFDFESATSVMPEAEKSLLKVSKVRSLKRGQKITLRILPGKETPVLWYKTFFRHYLFGLEGFLRTRVIRPFLCNQRCFNEPCFFCDLGETLLSSENQTDKDQGSKIFPMQAALVSAYKVREEEPTVEVYTFPRSIMISLIGIWKEGVNFMDPKSGCPIVFKPIPDTNFFAPEALIAEKGKVPKSLLDQTANLNEVFESFKVDYGTIAANFVPAVLRSVVAYYEQKGMSPPEDLLKLVSTSKPVTDSEKRSEGLSGKIPEPEEVASESLSEEVNPFSPETGESDGEEEITDQLDELAKSLQELL